MKKEVYDILFFKDFAIKKDGLCLSDEYINRKTKLLWQCKDGHKWEAQPRKILEGNWCPECSYARNRIKFNEDAFSIDSEESFYWAGFLAADGWKTRANGSYSIGLELSQEDIQMLEKFKKFLAYEGYIKKRFRIGGKSSNGSHMACIKVSSPKTWKDLERFNIIERKTYVYHMPEWLIKHPLVNHFMRGYIDGDGSFYIHNNKNGTKHVGFSMKATAVFLNQFNSILVDKGIITREHIIIPKDGLKNPAFDCLRYGGNYTCSKLYDFLYENATIYLERKKQVAEKAKEWVVYGTDKKKKPGYRKFNITKEILLEKAREFKSRKEMAEYFGCTAANISYLAKSYNIQNEMSEIFDRKISNDEILKLYKEHGTYAEVARIVGLSKVRISQIIKENNNV